MNFNIAIDGPAGAGKSTIAKLLAKELNYIYLDTGAMYRAMSYYFIKNGMDYTNEELVVNNLDKIDISFSYNNGVQEMYLNSENISGKIRTEECSKAASSVSRYLPVRERLVKMQQDFAKNNNVIMDGRDIGTVVLPNANLKIFLTASVESRAKRRYEELKEKGEDVILADIEKDIAARDYQDMHRENSPLKCADDAITLDTTDMTIEEEVAFIKKKMEEKLNEVPIE